MTPEKCQSELNDVLHNNPTITFLLDKIESSGCAIDRSKFFKIEKCSKQVCGGFVPEKASVSATITYKRGRRWRTY